MPVYGLYLRVGRAPKKPSDLPTPATTLWCTTPNNPPARAAAMGAGATAYGAVLDAPPNEAGWCESEVGILVGDVRVL